MGATCDLPDSKGFRQAWFAGMQAPTRLLPGAQLPRRVEGWLSVCEGDAALGEEPSWRRPANKRPRRQGIWESKYCVLLPGKATLALFPSEELARRFLGQSWRNPTMSPEMPWELPRWRRCHALPEENEALSETGSLRDERLLRGSSSSEATQERSRWEGPHGSVPSTPVLGSRVSETAATPSRIVSFFSKRSLKQNPLKRTKSVTKLERGQRVIEAPPRLRSSRSHESLLQGPPAPCVALEGARLGPLHPSLPLGPSGREHCFSLGPQEGPTCVFACRSRQQCLQWLHRLRQGTQPDRDARRRTENSLRLWVLEAKGIPAKKRYFCELRLDGTLYARTSSKLKGSLCFWGEQFEFSHLPPLESLSVSLFREPDKRKRRDKGLSLGTVTIPLVAARGHQATEKWYALSADKPPGGSKEWPSVRLKWRYQSMEVMPLASYDPFLQYLKQNFGELCRLLEPVLGVRLKEEIATGLVSVMHRENMAREFLTELVMADLQEIEDQHLTFRGNSLATKATEAYLKLLGDGYLHETLGGLVRDVLSSSEECEVDPAKVVGGSGALQRQQGLLRQRVHAAWQRITRSAPGFPPELRALFHAYRQRLSGGQREEELCDNLISGSIFLRFLCPAILSPSLFGLTPEYPDEKAARSLTLIAKTIQTLANFTRFGGKEGFMEFMNDFVEKEWSTMKAFLKQISSPSPRESMNRDTPCVDLGLELAQLQGLLRECLPQLEGKEGEAALRGALDGAVPVRGRRTVLSCLEAAGTTQGPVAPRSSTLPRSALATGMSRELPVSLMAGGEASLPDLLPGRHEAPAAATAAVGAVGSRAVGGPPLAFSNPVYRWGPGRTFAEIDPTDPLGQPGESGSSGHSSAADSDGCSSSRDSSPSPRGWEAASLGAELACAGGQEPVTDDRPPRRSLREYEHEVAQLKKLMGQLQRKLSLAETQLQQQLGADGWASGAAGEGDQQQRRQEKDLQMKSIITRLITVEDELRREQREMQGMIRAKQQLIDAQERKIQTLDAANQRLLGALAQLRQHYQDQVVAEEPRRVAVHNGGSPPAYRSSSC
ncbi:ras GTPase-activating protein raskol isoform X1 [Ixodes scapularis]|uniref:ras GTPase-activating protein raskol isoform X1 n=1 Tax=Ixodes scapularis TaxID=6945 RepID=UPI001C38FD2B|nr:ras GTPase-activating protein raskol isoform X1 [Ixodes scapularis]